MSKTSFPELRQPPIVEVICGVAFEQVPDLDPLVLGIYWDQRRTDFPKRQLHPALMKGSRPVAFAGPMPLRVWLLSEDEQSIIQLQSDRFIMNWRAGGTTYPRFSERRGGGLLKKMLFEFEQFGKFVHARLGVRLMPTEIELGKVDILKEGIHYGPSNRPLAVLVPVTDAFSEIHDGQQRDVNLQFMEQGSGSRRTVTIASVIQNDAQRGVKLEFRFTGPPKPSMQVAFESGNAILNELFFKLVPNAREAFGVKGESDG